MLRFLMLSAVLCSTIAQDDFTGKYEYLAVMRSCYGEEVYRYWTKEVLKKEEECRGEVINLPEEHPSVEAGSGQKAIMDMLVPTSKGSVEPNPPLVNVQQGQEPAPEPVYDAPLLKRMLQEVKAQMSNFTCVLRKLEMVDANFSVAYDTIEYFYNAFPLDEYLKENLVKSVHFCRKITESYPFEDSGSPLPRSLQEIMTFTKCLRKAGLKACMKFDIKKNLQNYDLSGLPHEGGQSEDEKVETVLHLLHAFENKEELRWY